MPRGFFWAALATAYDKKQEDGSQDCQEYAYCYAHEHPKISWAM